MSETDGKRAVTFEMRCNRSIDGEQQGNDQSQGGKVVALGTREFTLISTAEDGTPFEPHVQYATMSGTLLFPNGFDSTEFERIRRGKRVRVTVEVLDDEPGATEVSSAAATPAAGTVGASGAGGGANGS